jgi:two-component system, NarL family, sensor kinase
LTNVFRHSKARKANVSLFVTDSSVTLKVLDDGTCMADYPLMSLSGAIGVGLGGMRQRAKDFGGELRVQGGNPGALVEVVIPLDASALCV